MRSLAIVIVSAVALFAAPATIAFAQQPGPVSEEPERATDAEAPPAEESAPAEDSAPVVERTEEVASGSEQPVRAPAEPRMVVVEPADDANYLPAFAVFLLIAIGIPIAGWVWFSTFARGSAELVEEEVVRQPRRPAPADPRLTTEGVVRLASVRTAALAPRHVEGFGQRGD